jgi:hypothetical protein
MVQLLNTSVESLYLDVSAARARARKGKLLISRGAGGRWFVSVQLSILSFHSRACVHQLKNKVVRRGRCTPFEKEYKVIFLSISIMH